MAKARSKKSRGPLISPETFSVVLITIVLVVLGILAVNTFSQLRKSDNNKKETGQTQNKTPEKKTDTSKKDQKSPPATLEQKLPAQHVVAKGESLWKLAAQYYNDGYKWTLIASENKLTNADTIHAGNVLTIPVLETASSVKATPTTYTVVKGDSLWKISEKFYGDGFQWYRLRDANQRNVGVLPNGRPLIEPGTVLNIP